MRAQPGPRQGTLLLTAQLAVLVGIDIGAGPLRGLQRPHGGGDDVRVLGRDLTLAAAAVAGDAQRATAPRTPSARARSGACLSSRTAES